jgi:hypothetical protein
MAAPVARAPEPDLNAKNLEIEQPEEESEDEAPKAKTPVQASKPSNGASVTPVR